MSEEKFREKELENFSSKVRHVSYSGHDCDCIPSFLLSKNTSLVKQLNLSHNNITNLNYLETFSKIEELTLDNNLIDDVTIFPALSSLTSLSLNNNKLVNLQRLIYKLSIAYPSLVYLSLLGNVACPNELSGVSTAKVDYQRYRCYVSCHLKSLRFLDWKAVSEAERSKGCELFGVNMQQSSPNIEKIRGTPYSPLPKTDVGNPNQDESRVKVGKIRYKYVGMKSEGNRFIKNNNL